MKPLTHWRDLRRERRPRSLRLDRSAVDLLVA
jgi:hypothetical protein